MSFILSRSSLSNFESASSYEWLEANGLGGWASSTIIGANTRRYHGLLIAAESSAKRWAMLSRFEETLVVGKRRIELSSNEFIGAIHPRGFEYLERFERTAAVHFDYRIEGFVIRKSVLCLHGENVTLVRYELCEGVSACLLELKPLVAGRDIHQLTHENSAIGQGVPFENGLLSLSLYQGVPELYLRVDQGRFVAQPEWWKNFNYRAEAERGFEATEDLFSPGTLHIALFPSQPVWVWCATASPQKRKSEPAWEKELQRRESLGVSLRGEFDDVSALRLAADQFLIRKSETRASIIAGYPWFTDWGRDAMLSIPGLCLLTHRFDYAKEIFLLFREYMRDGLLPNRFPDGDEPPEYHSVDGSLWAFDAAWQFLQESGDKTFTTKELLPMLIEIEAQFRKGTRFGIGVDSDTLLKAGDSTTQLTWMDAKVNGVPVTPRYGKPVEINALWVNALLVLERLCEIAGKARQVEEYRRLADQVAARFLQSFWQEGQGYFADCLVPENGMWRVDKSFRPNQVVALGLSMSFVPESRARQVIQAVRNNLFVGVALRSLARSESGYRGVYRGNPQERDGAYHQGTAWAWLLAPYLRAVSRYGSPKEFTTDGEAILQALHVHLREAGIGSVSEIFDGDAPFTSRGCPFQAWSVAAAIECFHLLGKWQARHGPSPK